MDITDLTPVQLTVATIIILFSLWFWFYVLARLMGLGVARSWFEFMRKNKPPKKGKQQEEE